MVVVYVNEEFTSTISAPRLFKALVLHNLLPNILPNAIKSVEMIKGTGGRGSIKQLNFAEGSEFKYMKQKIDALEWEKLRYRYTLIEGDALINKLEKITYDLKIEAAPGGGSKGVNVCTCYIKPGVEIKEKEVQARKEKAVAVFKAIEAYLLANPDLYA